MAEKKGEKKKLFGGIFSLAPEDGGEEQLTPYQSWTNGKGLEPNKPGAVDVGGRPGSQRPGSQRPASERCVFFSFFVYTVMM